MKNATKKCKGPGAQLPAESDLWLDEKMVGAGAVSVERVDNGWMIRVGRDGLDSLHLTDTDAYALIKIIQFFGDSIDLPDGDGLVAAE